MSNYFRPCFVRFFRKLSKSQELCYLSTRRKNSDWLQPVTTKMEQSLSYKPQFEEQNSFIACTKPLKQSTKHYYKQKLSFTREKSLQSFFPIVGEMIKILDQPVCMFLLFLIISSARSGQDSDRTCRGI